MKALEIAGTTDTPYVNFNFASNVYKMGGESRPENANLFYRPVIDWVKDLKGHLFYELDLNKDKPDYKKELEFEFHFEYLNSISIKFIYDLLKEIQNLNDPKPVAKIVWYYLEGDEMMIENGKDYAELLKTDIIFKVKKQ